ncbi:MAG: hypothetical protein A2452_00625 [Candidatus Firestonebacteria bacterium RIFOXYC2_FULL_39_67]|nr:MAG: hypothetical protein A2536_06175 [Candidatus Firestonebacteria bacterium RIFOXYD2_FULL_39_29]OGF56061.1 MAG: hypothetical protein A2452_00625 [Candidatus Firestonebacteria bacterium RIFOXYC2_FULL_39_67]
MKPNLGAFDRKIRLGAGIILILISILLPFFAAAILGVYALLTGLMGWCPFNGLFSINTIPAIKNNSENTILPDSNERK